MARTTGVRGDDEFVHDPARLLYSIDEILDSYVTGFSQSHDKLKNVEVLHFERSCGRVEPSAQLGVGRGSVA